MRILDFVRRALSRQGRLTVFAAMWGCGLITASLAQDYPQRPINIIVPYSAGTATDLVARLCGDILAEELKASVVVENRPGANGVIATQQAARASADGHTLLLTGAPHFINRKLYRNLPYDPVADFKPVVRVASTYLVLVTGKGSPYASLSELIAYGKANPGKLQYASNGPGSPAHLAAALLASRSGVSMVHVPYQQANLLLGDVVAGRVPLAFIPVPSVAQVVKSGDVKAIGVSGPQRSQNLANVPSIAEQGYPDFSVVAWLGLMVPSGVSDKIIEKLSDTIKIGVGRPAFRERLATLGLEADFKSARDMAAQLPAEVKHWDDVVEISGAKLEN